MELVYDNFEKKIEILPNRYLLCSNAMYGYSILCEYIYPERTFFRVVWNIDNGFNTKEKIQKEIEDIVKEVKELEGIICC